MRIATLKRTSIRGMVSSLAVVLMIMQFARVSAAASSPSKVTVHVPSKSLAIMPYYFGKDKGFFSELIEPTTCGYVAAHGHCRHGGWRAGLLFNLGRRHFRHDARAAAEESFLYPAG